MSNTIAKTKPHEEEEDKKKKELHPFRLLPVEIDTLSKVQFVPDEEGELVPKLIPSGVKEYIRKTQLILDPDGCIVYPQSIYLVSKIRGQGKVKDVSTIAQALLLYTKWLDATKVPYTYLTEFQEEGAPWNFAKFLIKNIRKKQKNGEYKGAYSVNTARTYMGAVLGFYTWMSRHQILVQSEDRVVTEYEKVLTGKGRDSIKDKSEHDMMTHTHTGSDTPKEGGAQKSDRTPKEVEASSVMQMFPKVESTESHKKLKPLTIDDEAVFDEYISKLEAPFPLMFRLAKATGVRIYELATFPAEGIGELEPDDLDVVSFPIGPLNGCKTKYDKPRTIEIPTELYNELEEYLYSNERAKWLKKRDEKYNKAVEEDGSLDEFDHEPLFMSNRGMPYDTNTLETQFWGLRDEIRIQHPNWYYRPHDLRSTFATRWLFSNAQYRRGDYDFLMDELSDLMGHSDTSTTEKYIKFAKKKDSQIYVAKKKNNRIQKVVSNGC